MSFSSIYFLGALAAGLVRAETPQAADLLVLAAKRPAVAYEGQMAIEGSGGVKMVDVRYAPPGRYRREIRESGERTGLLVVSDGDKEWVYDPVRRKAWESEVPDPDDKQMDADDELALLAANYDLRASTGTEIAGRSSWRLDLVARSEARFSRSIWLDRRYGIVLQRENFRPDGSLLSRLRMTRLAAPAQVDASDFHFQVPPGVALAKRATLDFMTLEQAKGASGIEPKTPHWLPSGFAFESLDVLPYHGKKIVHYRYSDGVNALSLFQCPPRSRVDFGKNPREKTRVAGARGYLSWSEEGTILGWTVDHARMVLVGPLGADALKKVAESVR